MAFQPAPAWQTTIWFNTPQPLDLAQLRGKVVVLYAFQMLCPGCVTHGIPQTQRVATTFARAPLAVVGLHTVFEHHAAMTPEALRAFLYEYRVTFPVGVDVPGPDGDPIPRTMRAYAMQGTPTLVLIDAQGCLRRQVFGTFDDLALGADIGGLLAEIENARSAPAGVAGHAGARRPHEHVPAQRGPVRRACTAFRDSVASASGRTVPAADAINWSDARDNDAGSEA